MKPAFLLLLTLAAPLAAEEPVRTYGGTVVIEPSLAADGPAMIVSDPHRSGNDEAVARLRRGRLRGLVPGIAAPAC
jgi:hypothetical protein